ncbi:MAG: cupredoxin domain-containing protein [Actinomycetota bacterium]
MASIRKILTMLVLCVGAVAPAHASTTHDVDVSNFAFTPAKVQAVSGDTIHWTWSSGTHTVTAYSGASFDSGTQATGSFDFAFNGGTVLYYCNIHSSVDPVTLVCSGPMCGAITDKTTAPSVPSISSPAASSTQSSNTVRVGGASDEGTTVNVIEAGATIGTAVANSSGIWNVDVDFSNGSHTISAQATDVNGLTSAVSSSTTFSVNAVDTQPPTATIDQRNPSVFTGNVLLTGTASDDVAVDHVDVLISPLTGQTTTLQAACSCGGPNATWDLNAYLPPGVFQVQARAVDGAGLEGTSSTIAVINA